MLHPHRRRLISLALASAIALPGFALAQEFPTRPIRLVVAYPPGGATDALARRFAFKMSETLGQPVVVENKAGAAGNLGTAEVAKSRPDGYTLLFGTSNALAGNFGIFKKMPFASTDFAGVGIAAFAPSVIAVNPKLPVTTIADLVKLLKQRPGAMAYASAGVGASSHFAGELLKTMAGVQMTHVPYKGDAPAISDGIAGHVPIISVNLPSAIAAHKAGQLRILAVTSATRSQLLAELPTVAESGLPGYDLSAWYGMMAPAATPAATLKKLRDAFGIALQDPTVREAIAASGGTPASIEPEKIGEFVAREVDKWGKIAREANIQVEE